MKVDHTPTGNICFGVVAMRAEKASEFCIGLNRTDYGTQDSEWGFFAYVIASCHIQLTKLINAHHIKLPRLV